MNYDPPNHHEDYVHRVGRTGRAGNKGTAITFIGPDEERYAPDLVKALRESSAPVPAVRPLPSPPPHQLPLKTNWEPPFFLSKRFGPPSSGRHQPGAPIFQSRLSRSHGAAMEGLTDRSLGCGCTQGIWLRPGGGAMEGLRV